MSAPPPFELDMAARARLRIRVRGAVQGVGFRPFVYRRAAELGLAGWVTNSTEGVTVEAEGDPGRLAALVESLRDAAPAPARVSQVETCAIPPCAAEGFEIRASVTTGARSAEVLPDLATCEDCLAELFDASDRRYLYPFINCTSCGPRYSIIEDLPYDRARTSMRRFEMCAACRSEYDNPADRRFHAEPNACADCGPSLALWDSSGAPVAHKHDALLAAARMLGEGRIVAVKGLGGFHLMVDAQSEDAVRALRRRKRRPDKPFAVMFASLAEVATHCRASAAEAALLVGPERPIVLVRRNSGAVADAVAPGNPWLGVLLAYAPLHHLLLGALGFPVVATSGNLCDEPIVTDEHEAVRRLAGIADAFLVHDRAIVRPLDDSVVRVVAGRMLMLRRARGYAPAPVGEATLAPGILALGGHLKATVALTTASGAIVSQHIGDLDTVEARAAYRRAADDIARLHDARPRLVVRDLHPDYDSSRVAEAAGLPVVSVPHHLAHVAACLAENGLDAPVLGVAWDGTGYGPDGTVWGGEFLHVTARAWRRVAHLATFRLPGGEAVAREPRRAALGALYRAFGPAALDMTDLAPVAAFEPTERRVLGAMLARGLNAPVTSSAGRLFDAVAALAGVRQRASYEGQAAAELEWAAGEGANGARYDLALRPADGDGPLVVDWLPALAAIVADLRAGIPAAIVSAKFHDGLAAAIAEVAAVIGEPRVVLSGGCFQNKRLTESTVAALRARGLEPVWHRRVPPNDGGIALGQAAWAAWSESRGETPCAWRSPDES